MLKEEDELENPFEINYEEMINKKVTEMFAEKLKEMKASDEKQSKDLKFLNTKMTAIREKANLISAKLNKK